MNRTITITIELMSDTTFEKLYNLAARNGGWSAFIEDLLQEEMERYELLALGCSEDDLWPKWPKIPIKKEK